MNSESIWEKMLSNPSQKLKAFARGTLALDIVGSIFGGIAAWIAIDDFYGLFVFLGTVIGGILMAWFLTLLVEGFATLVEKAEEAPIAEGSAFRNITVKNVPPATALAPKAPGLNSDGSWNCSCGRKNSSYVSTCTCGKQKREFIMEHSK